MNLQMFALAAILSSLAAGCSLTHEGFIYKDPKVSVREIRHLRRVAIVPNRLPVLIVNSEEWRKRNWQIIRKEFEAHRIRVVDYDTSVRVFIQSGLPLEDSTAVRDKYAQLCEDLTVDAIIIPYYATIADTSGAIFITHAFHSLATFQIYLKHTNQFITRVDASGTSDYETGFVLAGSLLSSIANVAILGVSASGQDISKETVLGVTLTGLGLTALGAIIDIAASIPSKESHWTEAFEKAIPRGLDPVFAMLEAAFEHDPGQRSRDAERQEISKILMPQTGSSSCEGSGADCEEACKVKHSKQSCANLAQQFWQRGQRERGVEFYKRACDLGMYSECHMLGNVYANGLTGKKNLEQALEYYDTACTDGSYVPSCQRAAALLEQGQGISKNLERALKYYQRGCKAADKLSCEAADKLSGRK